MILKAEEILNKLGESVYKDKFPKFYECRKDLLIKVYQTPEVKQQLFHLMEGGNLGVLKNVSSLSQEKIS